MSFAHCFTNILTMPNIRDSIRNISYLKCEYNEFVSGNLIHLNYTFANISKEVLSKENTYYASEIYERLYLYYM